MDSFTPQAGGPHVKKGHEESDISVRGIFLFVVALVIMALASAVGSWYFLIWRLCLWGQAHSDARAVAEAA